jgi:hypothetical protein
MHNAQVPQRTLNGMVIEQITITYVTIIANDHCITSSDLYSSLKKKSAQIAQFLFRTKIHFT